MASHRIASGSAFSASHDPPGRSGASSVSQSNSVSASAKTAARAMRCHRAAASLNSRDTRRYDTEVNS